MNKTVLITGAARGLGYYLTLQYAQNGYNVIINYNKSDKLAQNLKYEIENKYSVKVITIKADISNELEVKKMLDEVINQFGYIDILINNAAISMDNYIEDKTKIEFMRVLEVNVVGTFLVSKVFKDYTKKIINISSTDAEDTYNEVSIDYCASKAALNNLTKTMSLAVPNVNIFAVMLPWINTETIRNMDQEYLKKELERTKQAELIEPEKVAKKIFELSQNNIIKTGTIIRWDDINE